MKKDNRGAAPGSNRGGGRKKSERKLKGVHVNLHADTTPIKDKRTRFAVDLLNLLSEIEPVDAFFGRTFSEKFSQIPGKTELEDLYVHN